MSIVVEITQFNLIQPKQPNKQQEKRVVSNEYLVRVVWMIEKERRTILAYTIVFGIVAISALRATWSFSGNPVFFIAIRFHAEYCFADVNGFTSREMNTVDTYIRLIHANTKIAMTETYLGQHSKSLVIAWVEMGHASVGQLNWSHTGTGSQWGQHPPSPTTFLNPLGHSSTVAQSRREQSIVFSQTTQQS